MTEARLPRPWEPAVLEIVARSGQVKLAAECAGVSRDAVYKRLSRDPGLSARLREAKAAYALSVAISAAARFRRTG